MMIEARSTQVDAAFLIMHAQMRPATTGRFNRGCGALVANSYLPVAHEVTPVIGQLPVCEST